MNAQIDFLRRGNINGRALSVSSDEKTRDFRERRDCCRQTNALHWRGTAPDLQRIEPFDAEGEMRPALIVRQGVDFVDYQPAHIAEQRQPSFLTKQNAETLGCGQQNVWRFGKLPLSLPGGGIAGAQLHADRRLSTE